MTGKALLVSIAGELSGHLHPGAVRGAYERMHYTVELGEPGTGVEGAMCSTGGLISAMTVVTRTIKRTGMAAAKRLLGLAFTTTIRARIELSRVGDPEFQAGGVSAAVKKMLSSAGVDRTDYDVRLSTTRLTVVLRRSAATCAMLVDVFRTAAKAADEARAGSAPAPEEDGGAVP